LNRNLGFCYKDRIIKWVFKQAAHGFQEVSGGFGSFIFGLKRFGSGFLLSATPEGCRIHRSCTAPVGFRDSATLAGVNIDAPVRKL